MALFTFNLPDIGEGISEAEIVNWHVAVDDIVKEDQPIADMMTDKATVEMESPVAGKIVAISGEIGDRVPIGSMLVERSEEHTSELQSLMRISYAVFCLKKKNPFLLLLQLSCHNRTYSTSYIIYYLDLYNL